MGWVKGQHLWMRAGRETEGVVLVVRKKLGNAVRRNRLKRRLRNIHRQLEPHPSGSVVVLAQVNATETPYKELEAEFSRLLSLLQLAR